VIEEAEGVIVVRKRAGRSEDRLEIRLHEVLWESEHEMGEAAPLEKDGVERDLQEALAALPETLEPGLRLDRREWPTELGPVDLMCRDEADGWVAVEIKRIATIDAVEQLTRYLDCIRADPARAGCRGILAAHQLKPQAVTLAASREIACVEVDLAVLRGEREPELTLFGVCGGHRAGAARAQLPVAARRRLLRRARRRSVPPGGDEARAPRERAATCERPDDLSDRWQLGHRAGAAPCGRAARGDGLDRRL